MVDVNSAQNRARKQALASTYVTAPQFGLVLGAGVTARSGVPTYGDLALRLLERASERGQLTVAEEWVRSFVRRQRTLLAQEDRRTVPPEEVVLFVRAHLQGGDALLRQLVKEVLYERASVARIVHRKAFEENTTLDAILTFCAARPNTVLAPVYGPLSTGGPRKEYEIETNVKVGGILTTNYDNLVEGAFHTKYRRNLLKPVGRPGSRESARDRRLIPVYHIHGYVGYRQAADTEAELKTPGIVIAEDDYFQAFYDPLGFGNYVAMSFLRRFPCLFIGSAMTDQNVRRFLFHLAQSVSEPLAHQRKFALLKASGTPEDEFTDAILLSYGVETIWIQDFCEIGSILCAMYTAVRGVGKSDWDWVASYRWT
jgi:hypothetical protein